MFATKEHCHIMLRSLFPNQPELQEKWWASPNKAFDGKTPEAMLQEDSLRVVKYLWSHLGGDYS